MSSKPHETFNPSLLSDVAPPHAPPPQAPSSHASHGPQEDETDAAISSSFASQLAGGGEGDFVIPEQTRQTNPVVVAIVALLAVTGGGIWYMNQRAGGPSAAEAADPSVAAAQESIQQFLSGGASSVTEMRALLSDTEQIRSRFDSYEEDRRVPLESLKTNPFWLEQIDSQQGAVDTDLGRRQEEARRRQEAERLAAAEAAAAKAASAMDLQTIFYGRNPTCMINGQFCRVGTVINDFEIISILPDVVEVRREQWTFELRIRR